MSELSYDISISTEGRSLVAISDFRVAENHITFLFGESGIGKSLIAKTLYGLLDPHELDISVNGIPYAAHLRERRTKAVQDSSFFVFQEPSSHLHPLLRLNAQLREGSLAEAKDVMPILQELWQDASAGELESILPVYPKPFRPSGGEKQRILCAMAFLKMGLLRSPRGEQSPALFVFDEPTGSLDNRCRDVFLTMLFDRFRQKPATTLLITHDYSMISAILSLGGGLMKSIALKELVRAGNGLRLRDFSAATYANWLNRQHPVSFEGSAQGEVLKTGDSMEVLGSRLTLTKDREGRIASPLTIRRGSMVYVKAPSGTGKTTLIKVLMGLIRGNQMNVDLGGLHLNGQTPDRVWHREVWGKKMALVFQHADEALNVNSTVEETFRGLPSGTATNPSGLQRTLKELFEGEVTGGFLRRKVGTLSGGQKQKLNLLRCLVLDTGVLMLDEPLSGLDFSSIEKIVALLQRKQREGMGLLVVSHNEEIFDAIVRKEDRYYLWRRPKDLLA